MPRESVFREPTMEHLQTVPVFSSRQRYDAVRMYLAKIEEFAPNCITKLGKLAKLCTPDLSQLIAGCMSDSYQVQLQGRTIHVPKEQTSALDILGIHPDGENLQTTLYEWGSEFHLSEPLYLEIALRALHTFARSGDTLSLANQVLLDATKADQNDTYFPFVFAPPMRPDSPDNPFTYEELAYREQERDMGGSGFVWFDERGKPTDISHALNEPYEAWRGVSWTPGTPWSQFEKQMRSQFERYLVMYRERAEETFDQERFEKSPSSKKEQHFEWFVLFHVRDMSIEEIQRHVAEHDPSGNGAMDTVKKAIQSTADYLNIRLNRTI